MRTWIPWEEIRAELMKNPEISKNYDEEYAMFEKELEAEIALYGTVANPKPTPHTPRARALFPYRKNPSRAKEKPAFALQRKRETA